MEPAPPSSAESDHTQVEIIDLTGLSDSSSDPGDERQHGSEDEADDENADTSSTSSGFEITLDETARARLHDAISTVREDRLRRLVHNLANTVPAAEEALIRELVTLKRKTRDEDDGEGEGANVDVAMVVPRWETCGNCGEEFDVGDAREEEECIFHPGELDVNEDEFADWDDRCHGPKDTPENRSSYPENFMWSCCDESGNSEGCVRGHHRAAVARKKRRI